MARLGKNICTNILFIKLSNSLFKYEIYLIIMNDITKSHPKIEIILLFLFLFLIFIIIDAANIIPMMINKTELGGFATIFI